MGATPPVRAAVVRDPRTIGSLIVVAAALLDSEGGGRVVTLEQLIKKMHELRGGKLVFDMADVQAVLPTLSHCLCRTRAGWYWRRRCAPGPFS